MKALILAILVLAALLFFFFRVSRYSAWRPGQRNQAADDGFGNHGEQRFLEEDHGVTMSGDHGGAQSAAGRESSERNIGYWGR